MPKINLEQMDSFHYDVLKEIGNIGAGNATTALSMLIGGKIDMKVPKVDLLEFTNLADIVGGAEAIVVGVLLTLEGDVDGMMMFMLEQTSAHHLVNRLLGKQIDASNEFDEMDLSALNEIGNIITGAYLSSLSTLTNLLITPSIPYMAIDMAGAILSVPAIEFGKLGDRALVIDTEFGDEDLFVDGYFILIPSLNSYEKILSSLGLYVHIWGIWSKSVWQI